MVEVKVQITEEHALIVVNGEVDASSSIHLDEAMQQAVGSDVKAVLVNCKHLTYISSAGLGVFMSYIQELEARDIKFILFDMNETVYKTFEILGLHQLLTIVDTEEDAKILTHEL